MRPYAPTNEEIVKHVEELKKADRFLTNNLLLAHARESLVRLKTPPARVKSGVFVRRQSPRSKFSHFDGTWEELENLVEENFDKAKPGYREGVMLVPLAPAGFWASTVQVTPSTTLKATFGSRRENELSFVSVTAVNGEKMPAKAVDIVLYHRDVLAETGEATVDTEWEIVSVNAHATEEEEPMHPLTMARNMLQLPGGTKGEYTGEQFAKSIAYWADKVLAG